MPGRTGRREPEMPGRPDRIDETGRTDEGAGEGGNGPGPGAQPGAALRSAVIRTAVVNMAMLLSGTGACLYLFGRVAATGYGVGYALGAVNIVWLFRIAGKGLAQPREKVARFVAVRYYLRFIITALVFMALIVKGSVSPVPLLAGLSAAVVTTIAAMIIVAKKEAS